MLNRNIVLLGSTGSIGRNTLEVVAANPDKFKLVGLAAGKNIDLVVEQTRIFDPEMIAVEDSRDAENLSGMFPGKKIYSGSEGLLALVSDERVDTVVSAISGTSPVEATLESIKRNHRICLANKESLVAAGELINRGLENSNSEILPIDSEQSAIFQSVGTNSKDLIKRIILTASGGPFLKRSKGEFSKITVKEALAHPTWSMGTKITIDSATLMNKALEVIEAFYLFKLKKEQIDVIIHPQSIVHSMVEFIDSSVIAQMSIPDMKIPILYSLSYPERISSEHTSLDLAHLGKLEFLEVDVEKFNSIKMAYYVLDKGENAGAVLNAANEVAVEFFLKGEIPFSDIFSTVGEILEGESFYPIHSIDDINETITHTKNKTVECIKRRRSRYQ